MDPSLIATEQKESRARLPFAQCLAMVRLPSYLCDEQRVQAFQAEHLKLEPIEEEKTKSTFGYPSVSFICSAISDKRALLRWQQNMFKKHGSEGMKQIVDERKNAGILFHSIIEKTLRELQVCCLQY